jgi:hypothetical protein
MSQKTVETSLAPEVTIDSVAGDLQVKGWEEPRVSVRTDSGNGPDLAAEGDTVRLTCQGSCIVRLPQGATLQVGTVNGNARFKLLDDPLTIQTVLGTLTLRDVAETHVETVNGGLYAKRIAGVLQVNEVLGSAYVRAVEGDCRLGRVGGNLDARDVEGSLAAVAGGNGRVRLRQAGAGEYQVSAGGSLTCRVSESVDLQVSLTSAAGSIRLKVPGQSAAIQENTYTLTLGSGASRMALSAGGPIFFTSQEADWGDDEEEDEAGEDFIGISDEFTRQVSQQIESQVEAQMQMLSRQLNEQMESLSAALGKAGFSAAEADRILQRARETSQEAAARTQEKLRRNQERLERKLAAAQRKAEQRADRRSGAHRHSWNFTWPTPPTPPARPTPPAPPTPARGFRVPSGASDQEPVKEEERLAILRMLEQKKITLEQAEQLLAALEGKSS